MRLSILAAASPEEIVRPRIPEGEPNKNYPHNNRNQPEFASVILTLDHLLDSSGFHVHQKAVYSTESASEALCSLMTQYYPRVAGVKAPPLNKATFDVLRALEDNPHNTIALYFVPQAVTDRFGGLIVQVVLSNVCLQNLVAAPAFGDGSALVAINNLVNAVADMAIAAQKSVGSIPNLMLMQLEDDASPLAPKTQQQSEQA